MLWIKRNLILVISAVVLLGLLGAGGYYLYSQKQRNDAVDEELKAKKMNLDRLYRANPFPSQGNVAAVQEEVKRLKEFTEKAKQYFEPLPTKNVTVPEFKTLLDNTISKLQQQAHDGGVALPSPQYNFSFEHQKRAVSLQAETIPALSKQLAEVTLIAEAVLNAKVNRIESLRRVRVAPDEPANSADYLDQFAQRTDPQTGAIITPYQVTFVGFSSELSSVLEALMNSKHGVLVKILTVQPAEVEPPEGAEGPGGPGGPLQPGTPGGRRNFPRNRSPGGPIGPPGAPRVRAPVGPGGLRTVLSERPLRITLLIDLIKTVPPQVAAAQ